MDYDEREPSEAETPQSTPTTRPCDAALDLVRWEQERLRSPGGENCDAAHNGPMAWEWVSPALAAAGGGVLGGGLGAQRIRDLGGAHSLIGMVVNLREFRAPHR